MTRKRARGIIMAVSPCGRNRANSVLINKSEGISNAQVVATVIDLLSSCNLIHFNVFKTIKGDWKKYSLAYDYIMTYSYL